MAKEFVGQEYMAATHGKGLHQESKASRVVSRLTVTGSIVVTVVSVAMIAFCIIFAMCPVVGTSMMTTLNATGDNTDSAITCILGEPEHSDIVVCKLYLKHNTRYLHYYYDAANGNPIANDVLRKLEKSSYAMTDENGHYMYIIKRLIGKPGDVISMTRVNDNYYIYLNGQKLDETYLDPLVAQPDALNFKQLWNVLNDKKSADMQDWVTVSYNDCITNNLYRADSNDVQSSRYMLVVPKDHYFLMGDNRGSADNEFNHSWDSTYFGPLPTANYVSKCVDVINEDITLAQYLWQKFVYYFGFGWAWQR